MEISVREDTTRAVASTVQADTRNTQLHMWSGREETSIEAVAQPISSTAFDTSHCTPQESVYPVRENEMSVILVHKMWSYYSFIFIFIQATFDNVHHHF